MNPIKNSVVEVMGVFPLTSMFFGLRDQDKYEQLKGREVKTYP